MQSQKMKGYLIFNKNVVYNAYNTKGSSFSSFASLKKIRTSFLSKIPINPSFKNFLLSAQTFRVKVKRLVEEE